MPTAVPSAVAPEEMSEASGINYMAQRFGAVFATGDRQRRLRRQRSTQAEPPELPIAA
jgi:hypothetical protein